MSKKSKKEKKRKKKENKKKNNNRKMTIKRFVLSIGTAFILYSIMGLYLAFSFNRIFYGIINLTLLIVSFYLIQKGYSDKNFRLSEKSPSIVPFFHKDGLLGIILFFLYVYLGYVLFPTLFL